MNMTDAQYTDNLKGYLAMVQWVNDYQQGDLPELPYSYRNPILSCYSKDFYLWDMLAITTDFFQEMPSERFMSLFRSTGSQIIRSCADDFRVFSYYDKERIPYVIAYYNGESVESITLDQAREIHKGLPVYK